VGERVAFLGLGVMGFPMAGHLARAGHEVAVFNRSPVRAQAWAARYGGRTAPTPAEACRGASAAFVCVGRDADLREVALGPAGALAALPAGNLLVDHTTASAGLARELAAAAGARGVGFVDAPVSGGQSGAEQGILTVMAGGEEADVERARPLVASYARTFRRLGPAGSGQLAKMVNQICIAGLVEALAEGLHFAEAVGLDPLAVVDVISKGAAQSWQMENRHRTMIAGEFEHGFAVEWMRKDLGLALAEARRVGAPLPVTALVDQLYAEVEALGGRRYDTSSLLLRLRALAGTAPRR
jgi:3-hydroxyisobutyrate dehydrogenase-like beta-hydroxyacid dehydrogenase